MGFSLSWLAVKGKLPQAVLAELGLSGTGKREEVPESDLTGVELPSGCYLIVENHLSHDLLAESNLKGVSVGCEVVTCDVDEQVMASGASSWKDGQKLWAVSHDARRGRADLKTEGILPPLFEVISTKLKSKQQQQAPDKDGHGVDYIFDIPVQLGETLTGFRHDRHIPELDGNKFEILADLAAARRKAPFWNKLLGK